MKRIKSIIDKGGNGIYWFTFIAILFILPSSNLCAETFQDNSPLKTRIGVVCTQIGNDKILVEARARAKVDNEYTGISNLTLEVYNQTDTNQILIQKETTNKQGKIKLTIDSKSNLTLSEDGYYSIVVSFAGDDKYTSGEEEVLFRPAFLDVQTSVEDSVKMITVQVNDLSGSDASLEDMDVSIQVLRMFSNLTIATESTDEDGNVEIEFPNDLPGDENGSLSIFVKVNETDEFASLQSQIDNNWGVPNIITEESEQGELWSPNAPLWMVILFALLIALVWVHFGIIIYKLFLINKEGKALSS